MSKPMLFTYRLYRFRPHRVKLFDEPELGAGVFVTGAPARGAALPGADLDLPSALLRSFPVGTELSAVLGPPIQWTSLGEGSAWRCMTFIAEGGGRSLEAPIPLAVGYAEWP